MAGDQTIGYLCCLVSVIGFGTNYIPVKKVDVKDGVFFTLCLSVGVSIVGLIQWAIFGFYAFEPFAMLGGLIWAVANACVPFIIRNCGLGTGQLIWSVTNMSTGWATGTFGLFGKDVDEVEHFGMNVVGVLIVIASLAPFAFMRPQEKTCPEDTPAAPENTAEARKNGVLQDALVPGSSESRDGRHEIEMQSNSNDAEETPQQGSSLRSTTSLNFTWGFLVALVAGVFMGSSFNPATYLQQIGRPEHSEDSMKYVISHFSGILCASLLYFLVYIAVNGHKSFYGHEMILPGISSGLLWGIAQVGWFKANYVLSYVITFPIIVAVPGVMAAFWGTVLFGENRSARNMSLLGVVILLQVVGVIIVAVSKGNVK